MVLPDVGGDGDFMAIAFDEFPSIGIL